MAACGKSGEIGFLKNKLKADTRHEKQENLDTLVRPILGDFHPVHGLLVVE